MLGADSKEGRARYQGEAVFFPEGWNLDSEPERNVPLKMYSGPFLKLFLVFNRLEMKSFGAKTMPLLKPNPPSDENKEEKMLKTLFFLGPVLLS